MLYGIRTSLIAYYFIVLTSYVFADPPKTCPGGEIEGETLEMGQHWYVCQDGKLITKGCLSETHVRLMANETYISEGYVIECTEDANGVFSFTYKGCHTENGEEKPINDTWQDKNSWYRCIVVGNVVSGEIGGCIDDGKRYNLQEMTNKDNVSYECKRKNDGNIGWETSQRQQGQTQLGIEQNPQEQLQLTSQSEQQQQRQSSPLPQEQQQQQYVTSISPSSQQQQQSTTSTSIVN